VKDIDLRRIVAEVTREVAARAEHGGRPTPASESRRGGRAVVTTTGKNQRGSRRRSPTRAATSSTSPRR
jgi:hypothetical protein